MGSITALLEVQGSMLIYLALGFLCSRTGILNEVSQKSLSSAIVDIVFPCMIFNAMVTTLGDIVLSEAAVVTGLCVGIFVFSYFFGKLVFRKYAIERRSVLVFGTLISNAAFVGLPLVSSVYGLTGVFYTTIYMTVSRVFLWTIGVALFPNPDKKNPALVVLTNPNTIAMLIAIVYFLLPIRLPDFIMNAVADIGGTSTMFCMVMVGAIIARAKWRDFFDPAAYHYCAVRLAIVPLICLGVMELLKIDPVIMGTLTILVSAPGPTLGSVLASRYNADKEFASVIVLVSTILSMLTVPLIAMLYV